MSLAIGSGKAWIKGHYFISDTSHTIDLSKYVSISICCNTGESYRKIGFEMLAGTPATSPVIPRFQNTETKTYLTLCTIKIVAEATSLSVTDYRSNESYCGYVKCILGKCKVSEILAALADYKTEVAELNEKVTELKNRLTEVEEVTGATGVVLVSAGQCGDNVFYAIYSDGSVKLNGSGAMYNYESPNRSPFYMNSSIKSLAVSYGITSIGEDAFLNAENLTTAVLPDSLTEISSGAFMSGDPRVGYVHGLTNVTIPSRVTKLGSGAFWGSAIESLTIPASVTEIGKYLCRECTHLMSVRINSNLIGAYMFTSCENLKSFSVSSKLQKIGECIFTYCPKLTQIDFDGTVSQWSNIPKGSNWDGLSGLDSSKSGLTKIQCSDGYLEYKNSAWVEVKS